MSGKRKIREKKKTCGNESFVEEREEFQYRENVTGKEDFRKERNIKELNKGEKMTTGHAWLCHDNRPCLAMP